MESDFTKIAFVLAKELAKNFIISDRKKEEIKC